MPGFIGIIGASGGIGLAAETSKNLVHEKKLDSDWYLERRTLNKFLLDKPFYEDEKFLLLLEGVVLNRKQLEVKYQIDDFASAVLRSYLKNGEAFFNEFRGSFSGVFYDKLKQTWIIFTDHIGDKQVFFSQYNSEFIVGSEPGFVASYIRSTGRPLTLNKDAACMLLTYGYFIENNTLSREIRKLNAGHYLKIVDNKAEVIQYHTFTNTPYFSRSLNEWIDGIDYYFRQAIQRQFDKDLEYGYKHITTLSGGLDSRMTMWVAHNMGYTEQLNTTFSQSDYLDESIAKQIAADLKHEWLFKALDNGSFLKNVDAVTRLTYGGGSYGGLAHGKSMYDTVNFESYGIMHTGQLGDVIVGTFFSKPDQNSKFKNGDGAMSTTLIDKLKGYKYEYEHPNQELFLLQNRCFNGANQGLLVFQENTESASPFSDVDFLSYCYTIPVELRFNHKIYFDWILKKYREAGQYVWEKTNTKINSINEVSFVKILGKSVRKDLVGQWLAGAIIRRLPKVGTKATKKKVSSSWNMNPLDYWLETNKELNPFFQDYFNNTIGLVSDEEIKRDCRNLFESGNSGEKLQVITLLAGVKHLFSDF